MIVLSPLLRSSVRTFFVVFVCLCRTCSAACSVRAIYLLGSCGLSHRIYTCIISTQANALSPPRPLLHCAMPTMYLYQYHFYRQH